MEVQTYGGVVDALVAKIAEAGDHPNEVRRIVLTPAEMKEVQDSGAFTTTVSKYYGDSSTLIIDNIITDRQGEYISFYLNGVLVCRHPGNPDFVASLTYPAGSPVASAEGSLFVQSGANKYMLAGTGNPIDFAISKNANIELGLAARIRQDATNYGAGEIYDIEIKPDQMWVFALSIASLNESVPNVCDMYDITLDFEVNGVSVTELALTYDADRRNNYVWANRKSGQPTITDSAIPVDKSGTQMIQPADAAFLKAYMPGVPRNEAGAPLGMFGAVIRAVPKWSNGESLEVEILVNVSEFVEQP